MDVDPLDRSTSLVPLSNEMDSAWIISIDPAKIVYQLGKATVVADALSWSMTTMQQSKPKKQDQQQLTN